MPLANLEVAALVDRVYPGGTASSVHHKRDRPGRLMTISPEELRELGEAWEKSTGERGWQEHLASELPTHITTVRLAVGQTTMHPAIEPRVRKIPGRF